MKALRVLLMTALVVSVFAAGMANAQDLRQSLFTEADAVFAKAKEARADVLAPGNYGKALERYQEAEKKLEKGKKIEDIRSELKRSMDYLNKAMESTKLAAVTLADGLRARDNAFAAEAPEHSSSLWTKAEERFAAAARELESGDVNGARDNGSKAEALYRDAELDAIKNHMFDSARAAIEKARAEKADRYAPRTMANAVKLLADAEAALEKDRYDLDKPRVKTQEANYAAQHAMYITSLAKQIDSKSSSIEDLVLVSEQPLVTIAGVVDVVPNFKSGYTETTDAIVKRIETVEMDGNRLTSDLSDRAEQIAQLEEQIAILEKELGGVSKEQVALKEKIAAQEDARKRVTQIETMFQPGQARVLREGGDIIVRLIGMNFESGKAVINPQYFGLLSRVQDAVNAYGPANVRIEGHTDSYGTEEANDKLSQERADAVRQYLIALRMDAAKISAVGHGETRPIANNETNEGRARNRRIDVVISPPSTP